MSKKTTVLYQRYGIVYKKTENINTIFAVCWPSGCEVYQSTIAKGKATHTTGFLFSSTIFHSMASRISG